MKSFRITFVLPMVILLLTACQPDSSTLSHEDVAEIKEIAQSYEQSVIDGNWNAFAALFTENAVYMAPNEPIVEGRAALREWLESYPAFPDTTLTADVIDGRDDLAFVRGTVSLTMPVDGAEEPRKDIMKYLWIVMKQPDRNWQIALESFSSDLPLPEQ